jgi:GT2 family glycosyltransferase
MKIIIGVVFYDKTEIYINNFLNALLNIGNCLVYAVINSVVNRNLIIRSQNLVVNFKDSNVGSAGGFYEILAYARECGGIDYLLTIDDDLFFSTDALWASINNYNELSELHGRVIILGFRNSLLKNKMICTGYINGKISNCAGGFFRINLTHFFYYIDFLFCVVTSWPRHYAKFPELINNSYWGGMLISKNALSDVEFHEKRLFLYKDDVQFARNFNHAGGRIFIDRNFVISDQGRSWIRHRGVWGFILPELYSNSIRLYYSFRNTVYFQLKSQKKFYKFMSIFSAIFYLPFLVVILFFRFDNFICIVRAIRDALKFLINKNSTIDNFKP